MLCFDPRLELHRALYAVSESKSSHPAPGFIIGSILYECVRLVYRFLFLKESCVHVRARAFLEQIQRNASGVLVDPSSISTLQSGSEESRHALRRQPRIGRGGVNCLCGGNVRR